MQRDENVVANVISNTVSGVIIGVASGLTTIAVKSGKAVYNEAQIQGSRLYDVITTRTKSPRQLEKEKLARQAMYAGIAVNQKRRQEWAAAQKNPGTKEQQILFQRFMDLVDSQINANNKIIESINQSRWSFFQSGQRTAKHEENQLLEKLCEARTLAALRLLVGGQQNDVAKKIDSYPQLAALYAKIIDTEYDEVVLRL